MVAFLPFIALLSLSCLAGVGADCLECPEGYCFGDTCAECLSSFECIAEPNCTTGRCVQHACVYTECLHCVTGTCVDCIVDDDCPHRGCTNTTCIDNICNDEYECPDTDCIEGQCAECAWQLEAIFGGCTPDDCGYAYCARNGTCISGPLCAQSECTGEFPACGCEVAENCTAPPCSSVDCIDGMCVSELLCDSEFLCIAGECVECHWLNDARCQPEVPVPCSYSFCTLNFTCETVALCAPEDCDELNQCTGCTDDDSCGQIPYYEHMTCTPSDGEIPSTCVAGEACFQTISLGGGCQECVFDYMCAVPDCVAYADCVEGVCVAGPPCAPEDCVAGVCIEPGCVHALGWWYSHAESAFPAIAPILIGEGSIAVSNATDLRAYIRRSYGDNGLDTLAAMLLVAKLNIALGAVQVPGIVGAMAEVESILSVCPPNDHVVWRGIIDTSECGGHYATSFQPLIATLLSYSNGLGGVPLCTGVGMHH